MKKIILSSIILFAASCKDNIPQQSNEQEIMIQDNQVTIPENNPVFKKIKMQTVTEQEHSNGIISAGTIQVIPNHYAEIASPFSGRITKSFIQLGQNVSAGSPLFEILSSDYFSVQKDYTDAVNDVQLAEKITDASRIWSDTEWAFKKSWMKRKPILKIKEHLFPMLLQP
ncbi:efflux RND transporter periplasmic adaptor subunit [Chryseobacterium sp. 1B4]